MACSRVSLLLLVSALCLAAGSPTERVSPPSDGVDIAPQPSTKDSLLGNDQVQGVNPEITSVKVQPSRPSENTKKPQVPGRKGTKRGRFSNKDLLHHLGMVKLRSPTVNHHRKRLASQSRKNHGHKNLGDSKMYVVKLPPNPYYYAHHDLPPRPEVNSLPVDFSNNGKPTRVYHWNIPVLKKMVARKAGSTGKSGFHDSDIFNIDKQATWNDTDDEKSTYRKASFYAPKKPSKHPFRKYFPGNGKPHSFYVIEKNIHNKPMSVHRLLP